MKKKIWDTHLMEFLSTDFKEFLSPHCNRYAFLTAMLRSEGISFSTITLEEKKHIYIQFPQSAYNPLFRIKTIIVHYDRAQNTPGANDNSAAVFQMLDFIRTLSKSTNIHNMRIFFTDGEELGSTGGVTNQGAFTIASRFKKLGITNDDIFVFDGCGRGDVLIVSTAGRTIFNKGNTHFAQRFDELYHTAINLASSITPQKWLTLPVPYSDNAGFIASGIPAIAFSILPQEEAHTLLKNMQQNPSLEKDILTHRVSNPQLLPFTWRLMHTAQDDASTLDSVAFHLMQRMLNALAEKKNMS